MHDVSANLDRAQRPEEGPEGSPQPAGGWPGWPGWPPYLGGVVVVGGVTSAFGLEAGVVALLALMMLVLAMLAGRR